MHPLLIVAALGLWIWKRASTTAAAPAIAPGAASTPQTTVLAAPAPMALPPAPGPDARSTAIEADPFFVEVGGSDEFTIKDPPVTAGVSTLSGLSGGLGGQGFGGGGGFGKGGIGIGFHGVNPN